MSLRSRSRWIAAATAVAIPAIVLSTACSSDKAAAPASVSATDTVALDEGNVTLVEWYVNAGSDSGYYAENGSYDGNYVQSYLSGSQFFDYRMLMQFALPKLAGKGVVDSAKVNLFACEHGDATTDSVVADHMNWGAVYSDSASWGSQTIQANVGTIVRDTTTGWKSLDITGSVQADYAAKRPNSQYRLRYNYASVPSLDQYVEFAGSYCNSNADGGQGYMVIWSH
jgi:hypothetical protein